MELTDASGTTLRLVTTVGGNFITTEAVTFPVQGRVSGEPLSR